MADHSNRKFWQLHLSTILVLMVVAGALLPVLIYFYTNVIALMLCGQFLILTVALFEMRVRTKQSGDKDKNANLM